MPLRAKDLKDFYELASDIKWHSANLYHNVKMRRVTHTLKTLRLLIRIITKFKATAEDQTTFIKDLSHGLYQSQVGPTEIQPVGDDTVFITGHFSIEQLRIYLVVNYPIDTMTLEAVIQDERNAS